MESYTVGRNAERRLAPAVGYLPARAVAALPYNRAG